MLREEKMTQGTRETLLAIKPKLKQLEINGNSYYIRELTVGEMNQTLFGQQQELIKIAQSEGIELDFQNEEILSKQLAQVYDPNRLARMIAMRLCDENGKNLFDVKNPEDLTALSQLDKTVLEQLSLAIGEDSPKNSPIADDSK